MSPRFLSNRKLGNLMQDIVECNIITLGYNKSKCGSYVKGLNKKMLHSVKKVVSTRSIRLWLKSLNHNFINEMCQWTLSQLCTGHSEEQA